MSTAKKKVTPTIKKTETKAASPTTNQSQPIVKDEVVIRFAGDSGDGMQLTGNQFTNTSVIAGNDISTFPDFPAEIRAPAGSLPGVSGFQINFSQNDIKTPGDTPSVLIAMNPAALKVNLLDLEKGGILIINRDAFTESNLKKAGYTSNPLEDHTLDPYQTYQVPMTTLNAEALLDSDLGPKEANRCKNFFALGIMYWMYGRSLDTTLKWIQQKFAKSSALIEANTKALKAGYNYGITTEMFAEHYVVPAAKIEPGTYRKVVGNEALSLGLVSVVQSTGLPMLLSTYPITPASDILHDLAKLKNFGIMTFQAEDEIAAMGATIGASFAGILGLTTTSGPGIALKSEGINLAIMTELPMVIVNVQRGGPSTGLPTKTEQADLLQVMFGRNGESPIAVIAPQSPSDCFAMAIEAFRIALNYMTPVILLSDGNIANSSEPWKLPKMEDIPKVKAKHFKQTVGKTFSPYLRDKETLARPWAIPGTPGLEHRIGGLEKQDVTGNVSYDPLNHEKMVALRAEKIARIADEIPNLIPFGPETGKILVVGWGSTYGAITTAVEKLQRKGVVVSSIHLRYINPFPKNLGKVLSNFEKILIPEMNLGQLTLLIRAKFLVDAQPFSKVQGRPFQVKEIMEKVEEMNND
jgi:2-oxoglutarate/2-oxoacid ferredoxin oxidoreductase subunit alpha